MSIVVVFPAPFGPRRATVSPGVMSRSTPRTARTGPLEPRNVLVIPRSVIPAWGGAFVRVAVVMNTGSRPAPEGGRAATA